MTVAIPENTFDEEQLAERLELFRYTDMTQPLIQVLFPLQLPNDNTSDSI
ncbi:hypothetical protein Q7C_1299 [Methylophaga frappieri]|uniref:Uncharacterized protein n=1 Tax=Methylophaga frappieri (strain ATCC BAA-2434 / DSM 25690 / JAM7) TaxID=754477 RepID=I1YHQ6_METFJ|nr:hypothetical protein [Methylophaga frappieri]AFJ02449.1 hypothetical protein Q7C_1299 [Methylophaga frappieri]